MRQILIFLFIFLWANLEIHAQDMLKNNPLKFDRKHFRENTVVDMLKKCDTVKYVDINIQELRLEIWDHNAEIDKRQQQLIDEKNVLIDKRQEIVSIENITAIPSRIKARQSSIEKIRMDIEENLAGLGYKGIYLFACKMSSSWSQNKDLRNMAIKYITPVAIEYTNGSFISSITELKKKENYNDEFYKYIRDEIQGTCNVEAEILNTINRKGSYFIFIAKINTKPLQEHIKTQISTEYGLPENSIVINTLNNFNTIKNLNDIGIPKDEIKKIELEIKQWKDLIELENERIKSIERDFILTGDKKINAIYNEIDQLNQEFENKSTRLQALLEQATTTKFNPQNLNGTITNALYDIDLQISNLNTRILQLEEERLFANYQVMVTTSGDYFSEVANEAIQAQNELVDTYTKVENYVRIAELENDVYTKNVGAEQQYQRYSDKIWIFPEPGEGDYFRITIVVKFTLEEPGKKLNWW